MNLKTRQEKLSKPKYIERKLKGERNQVHEISRQLCDTTKMKLEFQKKKRNRVKQKRISEKIMVKHFIKLNRDIKWEVPKSLLN